MLTERTIHQIGRIDQIVLDYFETNEGVKSVLAKDLMQEFISKGIFEKDHREGLPIRKVLRLLDAENKLHLLRHCKVERKEVNRNWFFVRV